MNSVFQQILVDIDEVKELLTYYASENKPLAPIEIDILKDKLKQAYDQILKIERKVGIPVVPKIIQNELNKEIENNTKKLIKKDNPDLKNDEIVSIYTKPEDPIIETNVLVESERMNLKPEKSILAERYSSSSTINDNLSSKQQISDVSSKLSHKPLDDIMKAIPLNDRFIYIQELFSGNKELFRFTIEQLNSSNSEEAAMEIYYANCSEKMSHPLALQLLGLIQRKFQQ